VECSAPVHPHHPELGQRTFPFSKELWIEQEDFMEVPTKGYFRFTPPSEDKPGSRVRLKYGFVAECTGFDKDENGKVTAVHVNYFPDSKSGTPGADNYKVKGNITWVSAQHALAAEVRLYDRLFADAHPDAGGKNFMEALNPKALETITAFVEPGLAKAAAEDRFQFERHGYFVADRVDSQPGKPVFNRIVTLKDSWGGK
jgi:glutaminyl-tRNA synthetase